MPIVLSDKGKIIDMLIEKEALKINRVEFCQIGGFRILGKGKNMGACKYRVY